MTKWVANFGYMGNLLVGEVIVIETKKQYRVAKDQPTPDLAWAYNYATIINKSSNKMLFDTEREALQSLFDCRQSVVKVAEIRLARARDNFATVTRALEAL